MSEVFSQRYRSTKFITFHDNLSRFSGFVLMQLRFGFILKGFLVLAIDKRWRNSLKDIKYFIDVKQSLNSGK